MDAEARLAQIIMEDTEFFQKEEDDERLAREAKRTVRKEFLEPAIGLADMLRQSTTRVHFMKSQKDEWYHAKLQNTHWSVWKEADRLLSQFKYHKTRVDSFEKVANTSKRLGFQDQVNEAIQSRNKHIAKCTYAHYSIGAMYNMFLTGGEIEL